jgi:branched-chain amino acid transport system substrate-binding protein
MGKASFFSIARRTGWVAVAVGTVLATVPARAGETIAVAGPATGRHAATLAAMGAGARSVARDAGIVVREFDDGCDAARAEGAARVIAAQKPDLVIGHPCPAAAIAAARIYAANDVLFVALGVRHPDLTVRRAGPTVFRLAGRDDRQGSEAAAILSALAPTGRIAIVQDRTAYARGLTETVAAELATRKLPAPIVVPIVAGRRDYDADLAKLKAAPPEAIFFAGYPSEAAVVLRGLRTGGVDAALVASDANATDDFALAAAAHEGTLKGVVKVMVQAPGSGGHGIDDLEVSAGQAAAVWRAARSEGDAAAALVRGTAGGPVTFDENGDARLTSFAAVPLVGGRWAKSANAGSR